VMTARCPGVAPDNSGWRSDLKKRHIVQLVLGC
jgi:hypothetical protein